MAPLVAKVFDEKGEEVPVNIYGLRIRTSEDDLEPLGFIIRGRLRSRRLPGRVDHPRLIGSDRIPGLLHRPNGRGYLLQVSSETTVRPRPRPLKTPPLTTPSTPASGTLTSPMARTSMSSPCGTEGLMGEGINIAVVDDGMDWTHEDLIDNVNPDLNPRLHRRGRHLTIHSSTTAPPSAGIIAARDNDIGVRGV